jgi:hypothetical protein
MPEPCSITLLSVICLSRATLNKMKLIAREYAEPNLSPPVRPFLHFSEIESWSGPVFAVAVREISSDNTGHALEIPDAQVRLAQRAPSLEAACMGVAADPYDPACDRCRAEGATLNAQSIAEASGTSPLVVEASCFSVAAGGRSCGARDLPMSPLGQLDRNGARQPMSGIGDRRH